MKKSVKILALAMALVLVAAAFTACGGQKAPETSAPAAPAEDASAPAPGDGDAAEKSYKVALVSDMAVDEAEWLQNLVAGLGDYQTEHPNIEVKVVEATQSSEYEPKTRALAQAGYNIIITTNSSMADATTAVAADFPDILFGSLDGVISDIADYPNLQEFGLNRTETGYLAGVAAACATKANKVGIVAGADEPVINAIVAGWQQGMRSVNPDIEDMVAYANTWTDPTKGKELGLMLVNEGCDVIAAAAGGTGVGGAQAAAEKGVYFVAWDVHYQDVLGDLELGSAVNFFDKMVIQFIEDAISGNFQGGKRVDYGISEGVCTFEYLDNSPLAAEAKEKIKAAYDDIIAGKIDISTEPLHK